MPCMNGLVGGHYGRSPLFPSGSALSGPLLLRRLVSVFFVRFFSAVWSFWMTIYLSLYLSVIPFFPTSFMPPTSPLFIFPRYFSLSIILPSFTLSSSPPSSSTSSSSRHHHPSPPTPDTHLIVDVIFFILPPPYPLHRRRCHIPSSSRLPPSNPFFLYPSSSSSIHPPPPRCHCVHYLLALVIPPFPRATTRHRSSRSGPKH